MANTFDDASVSRSHARLLIEGATARLEDLHGEAQCAGLLARGVNEQLCHGILRLPPRRPGRDPAGPVVRHCCTEPLRAGLFEQDSDEPRLKQLSHVRDATILRMTWQPDEPLGSLLDDLIERRRQMFRQHSREHHSAIELKHSARGTLYTSQVLDELGGAIRDSFIQFASGITTDLLDALKRQDGTVSNESATWIRQRLERVFVANLQAVIDELRGGSPDRERLKADLHGEAGTMVADARRNLAIAFARVTDRRRGRATPSPAPPDLATIDELVQLKNRRAFTAEFGRMFTDASTASEPLSVARIDVDHFKAVNDQHGGHAVGDEALVAIAGVLKACVRGKGEAYRIGGDEFVLLLPNHTTEEATAVAERVRLTVHARPVTSRSLMLSVSVGVATYPDHTSDPATLEHAADTAAYDAKNRGRNLVRVFGEAEPLATTRARVVERRLPEPEGVTEEQKRK